MAWVAFIECDKLNHLETKANKRMQLDEVLIYFLTPKAL